MSSIEPRLLIGKGESSSFEFKSEAADNDSLARSIVAFANMRDGVLLLG